MGSALPLWAMSRHRSSLRLPPRCLGSADVQRMPAPAQRWSGPLKSRANEAAQ